jgi:hypothetical protein
MNGSGVVDLLFKSQGFFWGRRSQSLNFTKQEMGKSQRLPVIDKDLLRHESTADNRMTMYVN